MCNKMEEGGEEESFIYVPFRPRPSIISEPEPEPISVCRCLRRDESSEGVPEMSKRKQLILTTVSRTEQYLTERRIPELIRFIITKLISDAPTKPHSYLEKLLDDCMLFRAGMGLPPVLYEQRHLEAVVKSFDPMNRGWLTAGQVRRAYSTLGLVPEEVVLDERVPTEAFLEDLVKVQEQHLFNLLSAGVGADEILQSNSTTDSVNNTDSNICKGCDDNNYVQY